MALRFSLGKLWMSNLRAIRGLERTTVCLTKGHHLRRNGSQMTLLARSSHAACLLSQEVETGKAGIEDLKPENEANDDGSSAEAQQIDEAENTSIDNENSTENKPMSKSALKKLKKKERLLLKHKEMKEKAKEKKKELKQQKLEAFASLTADEKAAAIERSKEARKLRNEEEIKKKERLKLAMESEHNLVLDLDFCETMKEHEIASMSHQVMFSYAANAKSTDPVRLTLAGLNGPMKEKIENLPGYEKWLIHKETRPYLEVFEDRKEDLVYLTADSENVVSSFDPSKIYIIGGLVDHNRLKGVTLKKANEQGIATARLPITEHVKLASSTVLTVNHVVEIILDFLRCKDWTTALKSIIPKRKIVE